MQIHTHTHTHTHTLVEDCGPPLAINGTNVTYTNTVYLSEAVYSCSSGFRIQPADSEVSVCLAGGMWSVESASCERESLLEHV